MFKLRLLIRILERSNVAASKRTVVVLSVIILFSPPMIPANATPLSASAMSRLSCDSLDFVPSNVTISSPSAARRTMILCPASVVKSNACNGLPYSSMTKFVISTTLLMERRPTAVSRFTIHSGDGPTFTPVNTRAIYRGQSSGSRTSTDAKSSIFAFSSIAIGVAG